MENERWKIIEDVFHTALSLSQNERANYLHGFADTDPQLFAEVTSLLSSFDNESAFLDAPVLDLGLSVIHENGHKERAAAIIRNYAIGKKLGSGGMGDVYEAVDTKLNRKVALKFLSNSLRKDGAAKRQLRKEARAIAMLEHPNICAVYGIEQSDDDDFIVMQYIDGVPLDEALRSIEIDHPKFVAIAGQIAAAVQFAHGNGIIHRDLKPANIMLTNDGTVKVLDFGLAKIVEQKNKFRNTPESVGLSGEGLIVGTIAYMSPEQLRGETLDYRTDIFSLGAVFYEILTKTSLFQRQTKAETISAILNDQTSQANLREQGILPSSAYVIGRCLEKEKHKRFGSITEILEHFSSQESHRLAHFAFHYRPQLILGLVFVILVLFAGAFAGFYYLEVQDSSHGLALSQKPKVAILPINFEGPASEKTALADDLTLSIVQKLSQLSGVSIRHGAYISRYREKNIDPIIAGNELGTDTVFTGRLEYGSDGLMLNTSIVRSSDGSLVDSEEWKIEEADLTRLPEEIVVRIAEKIGMDLSKADRDKIRIPETESNEAKSLYLLGLYYSRQNKEGNQVEKAVEAFTRAKDIDQNYAKAWAGLAVAYLFQSTPGAKNAISPEISADLAAKAAQKAIDLDNTLAEAYYALAQINVRYNWNWKEAEINDRMAINLDPEFLPARSGLINVLRLQERYDEALDEVKKSREIDPLTISNDLQEASIHYKRRDYQTTGTLLQAALQRSPNNQRVKYMLAYHLLVTGQPNAAAHLLEPLYNSPKDEDKVIAGAPLGMAYAKQGLDKRALRIIRDLERSGANTYVPSQEKALVYIALGDYDKAFENLMLSCAERFSSFPGLINDPIVDELRRDPRFAELRNCANL
jgi:serine/threonine protein kinase/tetratricopeptide (TPR) repeat protein